MKMKKILNLLFFFLIFIGGVFAANVSYNIDDVKGFNTFLDSSEFASLNEYNDYTVPKKDGEVNLLDYLGYNPGIRNQGRCGSCWVWSGTLSTELALSIEAGIKDRLSIQYVDSNSRETVREPCDGGNWKIFADVVNFVEKFIPWTDYADSDGPSDIKAEDIDSTTYYPTKINLKYLSRDGMFDDEYINLLKDYLDHGKVIGIAYYLPDDEDWNQFYDFWRNGAGTVVDLDSFIENNNWTTGGGHAVNIVGYNEIERYWIVSNSWGNMGGLRSMGTFKMKMDMNYSNLLNMYDEYEMYSYRFWVYDYEFGNEKGLRIESGVDAKINIDKVVFDKTTVSAGEVITSSVKVNNDYEYMNLQNVRVSYFISKLGMKRTVGPFDIKMFGDVMKRVYLDIPRNAKPGMYDVRIVLQTENTKEVRYEEIEVK